MRIRRLELIGFKSFPLATTIEFSPRGITAIVGPNGCGKSNILDALLWVMGATSPKLLRSRSMEDVIFAGAEGLSPLGRAEVRLTIDNTHKLACEPYREVPEIEIRRVVYRDGNSEFYLNGHRCRLRDITEFFLGTGLGTNSYAIIEQGKVDAVTQAKPEERRLFLDESAGISKYKERRELSLRKMEATRQNLSRVEDVLYEVNRQSHRLKRQAAKARRYQRLKEQLNTLLIRRARHTLREMEEKKNEITHALETLRQEAGTKETAWNALEARIAEAQARLLEQEEKMRALHERYARQRDSLGEKRQTLFSLKENRGRLEEGLKGIRETKQEADRRRTLLNRQIGMLEKDIRELHHILEKKESQLREKEADYQVDKTRLSELEKGLERQKRAVFDAMETEVDAKNRVTHLTNRIDETKRGIQKREQDLKEAQTRYQSLEGTLASWKTRIDAIEKKREELGKEEERLKAMLARATERERSVKEHLRDLERTLTASRSDHTSLLEIQRKMEDVSSRGAKVLLGQFFNGRKAGTNGRLIADTIEIEPRYDRALEAILREELEFVLVETHETALESLTFLKEKNAGRSGLIPRDLLQACPDDSPAPPAPDLDPLMAHVDGSNESKAVIACLLKDVWIVDSYSRAVEIQKQNGSSGTLVTLEGDVFYPNGVIVGGSDEPGARGRVGRNRKIARLKDQIETLEKQRNLLLHEVDEAEKKADSLRNRLEAITESLRQADINLAALRRDEENARKDQIRTEQQMEVIRTELAEMNRSVSLMKKELTQAQQRYEDSHRKQAALREGLEAQEKKLRGLRDMVDRKGQTVGQLKIEKAETREKLQSHEQKLATLAGDVKTLNEEIEQKIQKETETVDRLDKITEEISRLEQRLREEETSLSALKETIETAELSQRRERERLRSIEEEKTKAFRELQALKERIAEKRLELTQQDMTIEGLVKETLNRFQIDPRQPLPRDEDQETAPPSEEEIEKLEKKLAGIGEINFVAVKEFDELQERLVFLERQKADLLEAIQTLTETIQRINRVTSSRFKETYDKVQAYFSELFQKLFGGGKGELRLTDPTNYRETGIEIFAQPPGKRLQVIRLLSGGEKALVAIAFLFAMFLTRPSPFCVLDEVDAPLDEGNIDRFNQLITELSSLSQFILITHNKRTMASADTLLGVTMEQPGVSKIVSVSLGEFENEAA